MIARRVAPRQAARRNPSNVPLPAALSLPIVRACLWAATTSLTSAAMMLLIRWAAEELHPFQISFLRCLFGALFTLPWLWQMGWNEVRKVDIGRYKWRVMLAFVSMITWFYGEIGIAHV